MNTEEMLEEFPPQDGETWSIDTNMWMDSRYGVALTYDGAPQALISFSLVPHHGPGIMIKQIQGVQYYFYRQYFDKTTQRLETAQTPTPAYRSPKGLNTIDYKKLLVTLTEDIAREHGIAESTIQRATNNCYTWNNRLPLARAEQIYDATALALGYSDGLGAPFDFVKTL